MRKIFILFSSILFAILGFSIASIYYLNFYPKNKPAIAQNTEKQTVVYEESVITKSVKNALPSVVTVGIDTVINSSPDYQINPFNPFSPPVQIPGQKQEVNQNIASGFIASSDGLIITNKHVVLDTQASYRIITSDGKKYNVADIYRDPLNDIAILKINSSGLKPLTLGDSSNLQLGQMAIAIGTPLGQFQNTVSLGIVSGLKRGITAGSPYQGSVETLNNVIQTDAPISPGNSGGPLLDSKGEVIGINTAIAEGGQNIGFAIPVNVVKTVLSNFTRNGSSFQQPFLGIRYQMISPQDASSSNTQAGAYVVEVISGSPADHAGIKKGDVITEFAGKKIQGNNSDELSALVLQRKTGETIPVTIIRNGKTSNLQVTLEAAK